jgi:hypothetical protein
MKPTSKSPRLSLSRETVRAFAIRTSIRTGVGGAGDQHGFSTKGRPSIELQNCHSFGIPNQPGNGGRCVNGAPA